ncbi:sporulation protein rmd1 [Maublancomyces gigas]|uniref:Sporulation protein rmd1 n=1 Tax=Discina gigas TaxID=1032678 RepID=A0ABR3GMF4_9PEZI
MATPTGSASSSSSSPPIIAPILRVTPSQLPPSALKNRRRSASVHGPSPTPFANPPPGKIGPQRTSKVSQKLKILPSPADQDEESGRDVYSQVTRIKDTTARRDAERLGKAERAHLPRVTAYATANAYKMDGLLRFLKSRSSTRGTNPKQFDECIYTPYSYSHENPPVVRTGNLIDLEDPVKSASEEDRSSEGDDRDDRSLLNFVMEQNRSVVSSEVFLYQYGVVVIWGMTVTEEQRFLKDIAKFESEKLGEDDVQVENFNFYVTSSYQPRIYNDFITLKDGGNYMIKLSISHAIAQSVKISLFEDLVDNTIEDTKSIPQDVATTGKVNMSRRDIMKHIGELFILRININLQGSVLDSPELMWAEPQLDPVYQAARSYLEINQRVSLLNQRLDVIGDLLQMLKEQMSHSQGEHLEWIVIVLIAAEILVAVVNVVVDLFAGAD